MFHPPLHDPETYRALEETVAAFARDVIRPVAEALDREERFPAEIYARMAELGLFGVTVPDALGGAGLDALAYSIVMEELSRGYASVADQCGLVELIGTLLSVYGTPGQQARHLPGILGATTRVAYCITEEEAGSDVAGIRSVATRDGDGWRLDGSKLWIHNAPIADLGFVLARTDPEAGHRGMSIFIVDLHAPGVTRGLKERKLGQRASQVGGLRFENVALPGDALLGETGRGFHIMMGVLEKGRVGIAALATGIAQAGLDAALGYSSERRQFGRAIGENQGLRWMLADMAKDIAAARALTRDAALEDRPRASGGPGGVDRQVLRLRHVRGPDVRRPAGFRRVRLHPRRRGRAALPRRQDHPDLRGHEPDPARHHRAVPVPRRRAVSASSSLRRHAVPPNAAQVHFVAQMHQVRRRAGNQTAAPPGETDAGGRHGRRHPERLDGVETDIARQHAQALRHVAIRPRQSAVLQRQTSLPAEDATVLEPEFRQIRPRHRHRVGHQTRQIVAAPAGQRDPHHFRRHMHPVRDQPDIGLARNRAPPRPGRARGDRAGSSR